MLCNECDGKQIYSLKGGRKRFWRSGRRSRVLSPTHNTGKSSFIRMLILFYVHIKMHIFQDQSQEAFDAFMHL